MSNSETIRVLVIDDQESIHEDFRKIVQSEQASHQQIRMRAEESIHRHVDARQAIGREVRHRKFPHMLRHGAVGVLTVEVLELVDARRAVLARSHRHARGGLAV